MFKTLFAAAAVATLAVAGLVAGYAGSSDSATHAATLSASGGVGGCQLDIDPATLTAAVTTTALAAYTPTQLGNAALIIARGKAKNVPARGQLVALITALQESRLRVLANKTILESYTYPHDGEGADHDSLGTFQQRPSAGWGTIAQLMDPVYAADKFYDTLPAKVPTWETMDPTAAAQAVQGSAYPDAYATWVPVAGQLLAQLAGLDATAITGCNNNASQNLGGVRATILAAAQRFVGYPYVWNAGDPNGPTKGLSGCDSAAIGGCSAVGFDCSGVALYAWAQAGIKLPHNAAAQYATGHKIPVDQAQPGDLLFYATNPADTGTIHHVAIYLGNNQMIEAPQSGQVVASTTVRRGGELMGSAVQPT